MYKLKEMVMYGNEGICEISEFMKRSFQEKTIEYYVLKPVYNQTSTIYVPINNKELTKKMKKVLSLDEIMQLIHSISGAESVWIDNDNLRKEKYKEILMNGNRKELMKLIRTLYLRQEKLKEEGKKFHAVDDKFYKDAEKLLYEEFAYVLNIEQDEVVPFICQQIQGE